MLDITVDTLATTATGGTIPTSHLELETGVSLLAEDGAIINREYP